MAFIIILIILILLCAAFLFMIYPNTGRKDQMKPFEDTYIAHRGFFDNNSEAPENSLPAFALAVENGYGIELDVQLTSDHKLVVFHDETLDRMCGISKKVRDCTYEELLGYPLLNSQAVTPLFEDVLKVIDGKVPLIVEVKPEGEWKLATQMMAEMMDSYNGCYCMESFHPLAVQWMKKNRPDVIRGQLSTNYFKDNPEYKWGKKFLLSHLLLNFLAKPDFIAYNHKWTNVLGYKLCRKISSVENVAWTIKNQHELRRAKRIFQVIIFDSFIPR